MRLTLISIFTFSCYFSLAQSHAYLLLDRRWLKPAVETDTVTATNLSTGFFPIYTKDLDTLISLLSEFKNLKKDGLSRKFYYSEDFKTERIEFIIENIRRTYGDGYEINLISKGSFGQPTLKLADPRNNLPENEKTIRLFLSYLQATKDNLNKPIKSKKNNQRHNPLNN